MTVKIRRKGTHISDSDISAFEQRVGMKIPADYREFLTENNGGVPETNAFDIPESDDMVGINEFLSLEEIEFTKELLSERFPIDALPIAYDSCGNYLCLVIGEQAGIYFWDHELEAEEGQPPSWDNMFRMADNFADFWLLLKPFDINSVELKSDQVIEVWVDPNFKPKFK